MSAHAGSNDLRDSDAARISVTAVAGAVDVTMAGNPTSVAPNTTVLLPARVVTGSDGNLGLTQAGTHVNVASDSDVEIPAEAVDGNLIARLVQHRGNVFYDVAPRDLGKLRVETPLLVAVIKGTQFNVAVQEDSTTIALFEGRLEIRTPDDSQVVQLNAGEIAIRSRVDSSIRVVGMNDERIAAPATRPDVAAAADARVDLNADAVSAGRVALGVELANDAVFSADTAAVEASIGVKPTLDVGGAGVQVEIAGAALGMEAGVDLGAAAVDLSLDAGVDLGAAAVDLGLDAGVDLGAAAVDLGLEADVDLAGAVVETGLDAGLDLGDGLDLELDAGVVLADAVDTSLDAGLTVDTGTLDVGLDADLDLGGALDVGLELDVGSGGLDVSLDLGGGDAAPPGGGLGGLLGGLL